MLNFAVPVLGHHSEAGFDTNAVVAFEATVVRYNWRNPHVYIDVETVDANGQTVAWEVETGATPIMRRSGWTPNSLAAGDVITVRGHPERSTGRNYMVLLSLEELDGTVLAQTSGNPTEVASTSDMAGVWKGRGPTLRPFRRAFNQVPLTEKGAQAKAEYNFYEDAPAAQCVGPASPGIISTGLYLSEIELNEDTVVIRNEFFDADRTVYLDGRGHPESGERTTQGHSIGWWEGNVLVVDTINFADHRIGNGVGVPSGAEKHVIERFQLSEDGTRMLIDVVLEDPEYLAAPFTGSLEWNYTPEFELFRYECDPAVSRRFRLD